MCYTSLVVTMVGAGPPRTVTNLVPTLAASGDDNSATVYFGNRGFNLLETTWSQPVC